MAAPAKSTPKDAQVMMAILKDMGVTEYEPRVVNQMLEFTYRGTVTVDYDMNADRPWSAWELERLRDRYYNLLWDTRVFVGYVTDVLDDAKSYSSHANKKNIDMDDVKLALQCKLDHSFTTPPPRDLLMDISRHKNNTALPVIRPYTGLKLPPDRYCLSNTNYRLRSLKKPKLQMVPGTPVGSSIVTQRVGIPGTTVVRPGMSNLGAGSLTVVTRGVSQPTFTYRPATAPVNPQVIRVAGSGSTTPSSISVSNSLINSADSATLKRKREDDDDYDV